MERKIAGVIPPLLTAFDKKGEFDSVAQKEIVNFLVDKVQGFYPCGTYGSGPMMSVEERKRVAEIVIDEVNGRVPVIMHVGSCSTQSVVDLAKHAESAGAYAVAAVPPIYYGFDDDAVARQFEAMLDAVSVPVFIYNNPKATGVSVSGSLLARLAGMGISGVKDSSFDIVTFYNFLQSVKKEGFIPIIGTEALILPAVLAGAHAAISGVSNAIPGPVVDLFNAVKSGDLGKAPALQAKVFRMRDIMHYAPTLPMIQAILREQGVNAGYPRLPFVFPDKALVAKAMGDLKALGISL